MESTYNDVSAMITRIQYSHHPCDERFLRAVYVMAFRCNCMQRRSLTQVCLAWKVDLGYFNGSCNHLIAVRNLDSPASSDRDACCEKITRTDDDSLSKSSLLPRWSHEGSRAERPAWT